MKAVLEYPKEEEHEEVDLTDLIEDGQIALSKLSPIRTSLALYCQTTASSSCLTQASRARQDLGLTHLLRVLKICKNYDHTIILIINVSPVTITLVFCDIMFCKHV